MVTYREEVAVPLQAAGCQIKFVESNDSIRGVYFVC
jgi:hypothetical protein